MPHKILRIGTRESQLAVWQATRVSELLAQQGYSSELVYIRSEGDINLTAPLYEMGVQGIFTRSLDIALLQQRIDIAVHSLKDVPTRLPQGIVQAAVLERGNYKDLLVAKATEHISLEEVYEGLETPSAFPYLIATSSIRRKAQWLHRYPGSSIENLRGNVNTRMQKLAESPWHGAIFAAAGLERTSLRPPHAVELDWMLPAPAQGAIVAVCREQDNRAIDACRYFTHEPTELCTQVEKDFLRALMGGCSTPISALAEMKDDHIFFRGSVFSPDGKEKAVIERAFPSDAAATAGQYAAAALLAAGGQKIAEAIQYAGKK